MRRKQIFHTVDTEDGLEVMDAVIGEKLLVNEVLKHKGIGQIFCALNFNFFFMTLVLIFLEIFLTCIKI